MNCWSIYIFIDTHIERTAKFHFLSITFKYHLTHNTMIMSLCFQRALCGLQNWNFESEDSRIKDQFTMSSVFTLAMPFHRSNRQLLYLDFDRLSQQLILDKRIFFYFERNKYYWIIVSTVRLPICPSVRLAYLPCNQLCAHFVTNRSGNLNTFTFIIIKIENSKF